jgi:hypothetical protein
MDISQESGATTRAELLHRAGQLGVTGRSRMTKQQLIEELRRLDARSQRDGSVPFGRPGRQDGRPDATSRVDAFRLLAEARASGEMVLIPRMLTGNDRRVHVRETLREDHETRIAHKHMEAQDKFDKLAGSVFQFFRGTCLLFYRDCPARTPACPRCWPIRGYVDGIAAYAAAGTEQHEQLRMDNAPGMIRDLIAGALEDTRADWLAGAYLDDERRGFRADEELVPVSSRRDEFQEVIERFLRVNDVTVPERAGAMRVKDVAERKGAGTASLGLTRFYVLIEGPRKNDTDDLLLEFKQARRSALTGLEPPSRYEVDGCGDRITAPSPPIAESPRRGSAP